MGSASKVLPTRQKIVIHVRECKQGDLVFSFLIILSKPVRMRLKYFYVFDTFYKCCLKAYNSTPRLNPLSTNPTKWSNTIA